MGDEPDDDVSGSWHAVFSSARKNAPLKQKMGPELLKCVTTNGKANDGSNTGRKYARLDSRVVAGAYRDLAVEFIEHIEHDMEREKERDTMKKKLEKERDTMKEKFEKEKDALKENLEKERDALKEKLEKERDALKEKVENEKQANEQLIHSVQTTNAEMARLKEENNKIERRCTQQTSKALVTAQNLEEANKRVAEQALKMEECMKERALLRQTHAFSMSENDSLWHSMEKKRDELRGDTERQAEQIARLAETCAVQTQKIAEQEQYIEQLEKEKEEHEKMRDEHLMSSGRLKESEKRKQKLERKLEEEGAKKQSLNSRLKEAERASVKKGWTDVGKDQKRKRVDDLVDEVNNTVRLDLLEEFAELCNGVSTIDWSTAPESAKERARGIFADMAECIKRNHSDHPLTEMLNLTNKKFETWEEVVHCASKGLSKTKRADWKKLCIELNVFCPFGATRDFDAMRDLVQLARHLSHYKVKTADTTISVTGVNDVRALLTESIKSAYVSGRLKLHGGKVRVVNAGDGGGNPSLTKLGFYLPDVPNPQSERNYQLYLVYDGSDDAVTLRRVARRWAKQINKIKNVTFESNGKTVTLQVDWFLSGDIKFLCSVMGHTGSASMYPCILCEINKNDKTILKRRAVPKLKLRMGEAQKTKREVRRKVATMVTYAARTVKGYVRDAETGEHSVRYKPLFNVPITHIVPGPFHCVSGAFTELDNNAERLAIAEHLGDVGQRGAFTTLDTEMKEVEKKRENQERVLKREECEMEEMQAAFMLFSQSASNVLKRDVYIQQQCCSSCIAFGSERAKFSSQLLARVVCTQCKENGRKFKKHAVCEALFSREDMDKAEADETSDGGYICKRCEHVDDVGMMRIVKNKMDVQGAIVIPRERDKLESLEKREKTLREVKLDKGGPVYQRLIAAIRKAGADQRAWFQKYTGNHIRKALTGEGPTLICGVFDRSKTPQAVDLEESFILLGKMQGASTADDLADERIEQFRRDKNAFFDALARLDKECTMRPKLHYLDSHVYPFMRLHGSWGRFAEQGVESKHANWNAKARTHCSAKKQTFVQRERIMNDMYVEHLYHLNPERDMTDELEMYKSAKRDKKKWTEIVGGDDEREPSELFEEDEEDVKEWETVEEAMPVEYDTDVAYEDESD